jgi:hypothetical protein
MPDGSTIIHGFGMYLNSDLSSQVPFIYPKNSKYATVNSVKSIVGSGYLFMIDGYAGGSTTGYVFDWATFLQTGSLDQSYLRSFSTSSSFQGAAGNSYYIYNGYVFLTDFFGFTAVYNLSNGALYSSYSNSVNNAATYHWRGKIYDTSKKNVIQLL